MIDGHSASGAAMITVCPQGPLLLRGDFEIVDAEGQSIDARQGPVAL
ncbi:hypothetical protein [Glutamicibacter sp. MCAF14]